MKQIFFFSFFVCLAITSCKKETGDCTTPCLVNLVTDEYNGQSYGESYSYDANERLIEVGATNTRMQIMYTGNSFEVNEIDSNNVSHLSSFGEVNNEGASVWQIRLDGLDIDSFMYTYNNLNQLVAVHRYYSHTNDMFDYTIHYTDNNPDTIKMFYLGNVIGTYTLEYFTDKPNTINFNPLYQEFLVFRFGKFIGACPQNLAKSINYGSPNVFTYTFDANCKITSFSEGTAGFPFVNHILTTSCN